MISPVGEVQGKIFVSVAPVVADALVALNHKSVNTQGIESSSNMKATDKSF